MSGASTAMLRAEAVRKRYGHLDVLNGIDLEVWPGQVMCLLGPSGSGKSTFLRCVNHLEKIDSGRLYVDGHTIGYREQRGKLHELREREICRKRAEIGMVFQRFNLFPHMTALQNVGEAPRRVRRESADRAAAQAKELLEQVGLGAKLHRYPAQLSGGEQQRVAIARAFSNDPAILLADEPTGNLDSRNGGHVFELLLKLNRERATTLLLVTHDHHLAGLADRKISLRDGRVVEDRERGRVGEGETESEAPGLPLSTSLPH